MFFDLSSILKQAKKILIKLSKQLNSIVCLTKAIINLNNIDSISCIYSFSELFNSSFLDSLLILLNNESESEFESSSESDSIVSCIYSFVST